MPTEWSFSLVFEDVLDYWEMVRLIAEVSTVEALHRRAIDELVQGAIATIATVRRRSPSPVDGDIPAASGEGSPQARDGGAQTPVNGGGASSANAGTRSTENTE